MFAHTQFKGSQLSGDVQAQDINTAIKGIDTAIKSFAHGIGTTTEPDFHTFQVCFQFCVHLCRLTQIFTV